MMLIKFEANLKMYLNVTRYLSEETEYIHKPRYLVGPSCTFNITVHTVDILILSIFFLLIRYSAKEISKSIG